MDGRALRPMLSRQLGGADLEIRLFDEYEHVC